MLNKILDAMRKITNIIVTFLFMVVVAVVFAQVVARYVAGSSIRWADELARFAFVWLVYLGGSITIREGRNVCFDLLLESCKGKRWKVMFTIVCAASAVFLLCMTYLGVLVCRTQMMESSPIMHWPMAVVCAVIPIGGVLMFFEQISYYLVHLNGTREEEGEEAGVC